MAAAAGMLAHASELELAGRRRPLLHRYCLGCGLVGAALPRQCMLLVPAVSPHLVLRRLVFLHYLILVIIKKGEGAD